jgi:hypothetical protein
MNCKSLRNRIQMVSLASMLGLASVVSTGCQIDAGGQTLPSPYFIYDDVQYFAPGPEFKLANEAAAMQQDRAQRQLEQ